MNKSIAGKAINIITAIIARFPVEIMFIKPKNIIRAAKINAIANKGINKINAITVPIMLKKN